MALQCKTLWLDPGPVQALVRAKTNNKLTVTSGNLSVASCFPLDSQQQKAVGFQSLAAIPTYPPLPHAQGLQGSGNLGTLSPVASQMWSPNFSNCLQGVFHLPSSFVIHL